jgi:type II secretory pathway pseudopilin PulG
MSLIRTLAALMILGLLASCAASVSSGTPTPRSDQSKYGP